MKLPIYIAALAALAGSLGARPAYLNGSPGQTCMQCHGGLVFAGTTGFLKINGGAASAPFGVTVSSGSSFNLEYRVTGLSSGGGFPYIGGFLRPVGGTSGWAVSTGPVWSDNGQNGSTPWGLYSNNVSFGANLGSDGRTLDDGSVSDLNRLNANEVFSATVNPPTAPGTYVLFAGAAHKLNGGTAEYSEDSLYVIVALPTPTPTFSASPTITPALTSTITLTPNLSETPTLTLTTSPTFSTSPTVTLSFTLTPMPSFPGFGQAAFVPNPSSGALTLSLETFSAADSLELRIYSAGFGRSFTVDLGPYAGGKGSLAVMLPAAMGNGAYYGQLLSRKGGLTAKSGIIPLVILR